MFIGICIFTFSCQNTYCFHIPINTFPIVLFHRSQFESSNSEVAFWATNFPNRSQYTDNVFDSVSDKSQVLETPMPPSPDHKSKYFTLTPILFPARGPSNMSWHIVLNFLNACGTSVHCRRGQPSHFCHDCDTVVCLAVGVALNTYVGSHCICVS